MASTDLFDPANPGLINTPNNFHFGPVVFNPAPAVPLDGQVPSLQQPLPAIEPQPGAAPAPAPPDAPLGALAAFTGNFVGTGFNTIFRPNNNVTPPGPFTTTFPNPVAGPTIPQPPNDNVLELNLTTETLSFSTPLGNVPNRGLAGQRDIMLNAVPYVQAINDVTNTATGKADKTGTGIHFEPGLWLFVPGTTDDPVQGDSLVRMASIPHGTTINAQTVSPPVTTAGGPVFQVVDITPFVIGNPGSRLTNIFSALNIDDVNSPRLPQDLSLFKAALTITKEILANPNIVLQNAIEGQNIISTTTFTVTTDPKSVDPSSTNFGGGTANIAFLEGTGGGVTATGNSSAPAANANSASITATFWIETVEHTLRIPIWHPGQGPIQFPPSFSTPISTGAAPHPTVTAPPHTGSGNPPASNPGGQHPQIPTTTPSVSTHKAISPHFILTPPHPIPSPITIKVHTTQIQYSQQVNLNFAGLTWPHVSVATLVPQTVTSVGDVWNV